MRLYLKDCDRFLIKSSTGKSGDKAMSFLGGFRSPISLIHIIVKFLSRCTGFPGRNRLYLVADFMFLPRLAPLIEAILSP